MKRAAFFHTKMDLLMERLDCPRFVAVGILESLWCLTAREAPRGDIGRLSNERIAKGIDWRGHKNATGEQEAARLIQALADTKWIDASTEHRFVIHDWEEHCDESVKRYLKRNGLSFACPSHVAPCRDMIRLPVASSQKPVASSQKPETESAEIVAPIKKPLLITAPQRSLDTWTDAIYMRHPKQKNKTLMEEWAVKRWTAEEEADKDPNALFAEIDRVHRLACESEDWTKDGGRWAPALIDIDRITGHLKGWLPDEGWRKEPVRNKASPTPEDEAKYQRALAEERAAWAKYHIEGDDCVDRL